MRSSGSGNLMLHATGASQRGSAAESSSSSSLWPGGAPLGMLPRRRSDSGLAPAAELLDDSLERAHCKDDEEEALIGALELQSSDLSAIKQEQHPPWLLGHPRGLYVLAATEVWERFGFYGMRSLLILYMTQELFLPENRESVWGLRAFAGADFGSPGASQILASQIYGAYTCLAYLTPMAGGFLADQYIGRRRTVMLGAGLMAAGYFLLGTSPAIFLPALVVVALGSGALKPNVSSQIGSMYSAKDSRKSSAFLIFYSAINLGACVSPIVSGVLHHAVGFRAGFFASGIAVTGGMVQYIAGMRYIPADGVKGNMSVVGRGKATDARRGFLQRIYFHRARLLAILGVCALTVGFWGVYEQQGNTLPVFADQDVAMQLGSIRIPTEFVQSINPFLIITFTPVLSAFWKWQAQRDQEPTSLTKLSLGCFILSLGYCWLTMAVSLNPPGQQVGLGHLAIGIALGTIGELYLAPVGLSFVSETAPEELTAFVMGMWFIAASLGFYVCGALGTLYSTLPRDGFFGLLALIAAVNSLLLLNAKGFLQRLILAS